MLSACLCVCCDGIPSTCAQVCALSLAISAQHARTLFEHLHKLHEATWQSVHNLNAGTHNSRQKTHTQHNRITASAIRFPFYTCGIPEKSPRPHACRAISPTHTHTHEFCKCARANSYTDTHTHAKRPAIHAKRPQTHWPYEHDVLNARNAKHAHNNPTMNTRLHERQRMRRTCERTRSRGGANTLKQTSAYLCDVSPATSAAILNGCWCDWRWRSMLLPMLSAVLALAQFETRR